MTKLLVCMPLLLAACAKKHEAVPAASRAPYQIDVTERGFEPSDLPVPAGKPVTLVFDRKTDATCAKEIVLDTGDGNKIRKALPLNTPVEIAATFPKSGKLSYACGMDMMKGTITVQ